LNCSQAPPAASPDIPCVDLEMRIQTEYMSKRYVVAMIFRRTSSVSKEEDFPRLLYCDSRCSQTCCRRSYTCHRRTQVLPGLSSAHPGLSPALPGAPRCTQSSLWRSEVLPNLSQSLLYQSSEISITLKAGRSTLLGSDALLKLTHLSLHSTSSQTLLEASSE